MVLGPRVSLVARAVVAAAFATTAFAQSTCNAVAIPRPGPGANAAIFAATSLPNGNVLVGGSFSSIDGTPASRAAEWNGVSWTPRNLASGSITLLATRANGTPIAAYRDGFGSFAFAGVKQWNGTAWLDLGPSFFGPVTQVMALGEHNGDVVVSVFQGPSSNLVGRFHAASGSWQPLGTFGSGTVSAFAHLPNGDLVAGGQFTATASFPMNSIARWNGSAWLPLASGVQGRVTAMVTLPNGDLVVGGQFLFAGAALANNVARWDGSSWSALGSGIGVAGELVVSLVTLPSGGLLALTMNLGTIPESGAVHRWDGTTWTRVAANLVNPALTTGGIGQVRQSTGEVLVFGDFTSANGVPAPRMLTVTSTCPAASASVGAGCTTPGSHVLRTASMPWLGSTFRARGEGLPSPSLVFALSSIAFAAPGAMPLNGLLPEGVAGCDLMAMPEIVEWLFSTGTATSSLAVPNSSVLIGAVFHHQMVPCTFGPSGNLVAVTSTNALQLTIGEL